MTKKQPAAQRVVDEVQVLEERLAKLRAYQAEQKRTFDKRRGKGKKP